MKLRTSHLDGNDARFQQVIDLLFSVFVGEKFTTHEAAKRVFLLSSLEKRGEIFIVENDAGKILGTATFVQPQSSFRQVAIEAEAEIHLLAVNPSYRGLGVGRKLVQECTERAAALGYFKIVLSTQPSMKAAHRLYEACGFTRNSSRDWNMDGGKSYWVFEKSVI